MADEVEPGVAFLLFTGLTGSVASLALWWEIGQAGAEDGQSSAGSP